MLSVLIVSDRREGTDRLRAELARAGFGCVGAATTDGRTEEIEGKPDLVLVEMDGRSVEDNRELFHRLKRESQLPVIAIVDKERLHSLDIDLSIDDFLIKPCDIGELALRAKRLVHRSKARNSGEHIVCGDLLIDLAACEVTVGGRLVMLTFKEYELLKFLASNKGRVFTRDSLLDRVWGYDYFGGDRTVDVHIRRLRSKIEDASHTFIETVRNIGYRFREDA